MSTEGSTRAVLAALLANTGIAVLKLVAWLLTGAASMLAEARVPARWSRTTTAGNPASTLTTAPGRAAPAVANPAGNARSTTVLTQASAKIRSTNASARA